MSHPASHHRRESSGIQGLPPYHEHQDQRHGVSESDNTTVEPEDIIVLAPQSEHMYLSIRFAYNALADVVLSRLPVAGWNKHDYNDLARLARALEDGALPLDDLVWDPAAGWSRERALVAQAMIAHIESEWQRAEAGNDEDILGDVGNDTAYLAVIFKLEDRENPFVAESGTAG